MIPISRGARGKRLQCERSEQVERTFALPPSATSDNLSGGSIWGPARFSLFDWQRMPPYDMSAGALLTRHVATSVVELNGVVPPWPALVRLIVLPFVPPPVPSQA